MRRCIGTLLMRETSAGRLASDHAVGWYVDSIKSKMTNCRDWNAGWTFIL